MSPVLVYASTLVSVSIILASGLSFLGLGVSPPTPDWGLMLSTLRQSIYVQPLVSAIPGIAILITSIAFNLVSDGLAAGDGRQGVSEEIAAMTFRPSPARAACIRRPRSRRPGAAAADRRGAAQVFPDPRRPAQPQGRRSEGGRRRLVLCHEGRNARHRRRIRLRQVDARPAADAPHSQGRGAASSSTAILSTSSSGARLERPAPLAADGVPGQLFLAQSRAFPSNSRSPTARRSKAPAERPRGT